MQLFAGWEKKKTQKVWRCTEDATSSPHTTLPRPGDQSPCLPCLSLQLAVLCVSACVLACARRHLRVDLSEGVRVFARIFLYMRVCLCVWHYLGMCGCAMCFCLPICARVGVGIYMCACVYVYVCISLCVYAYGYVWMSMFVFVCLCVGA
jgi:hypothetical protein